MRGLSTPILARIKALRSRPDGFGQNVLNLFAANTIAQALSFAAYPILTRIYRPDQMGILSVILFAMMILTPFSTLRYEIALPMCRSNSEATNVLVLCLSAVLATTLALTAIGLLLPHPVLVSMMGAAAPYWWFVPLSLLSFGVYNVLVYEATRVSRYAEISKTRVSQAAVGPLLQIGFGLIGWGTPGLLLGFAAGLSSGATRLSRSLLFKGDAAWKNISSASVLQAAKTYRRFPLYSSWAGVLLAGSTSMGNVVFPILYGASIGGFLFLSDRVLMQPLRITGNAFLQVFVGEAGRILREDPTAFKGLFLGVLWKQAVVSAAWLLLVYVSAAFAIPLIFGHSWGEASQYLEIMMLGYFPMAVATPATHTLLLMRKQRLSAAMDFVRFAALIVSIAMCVAARATPRQAVFWYSLTQGVAQCLVLAVMYFEVRRANLADMAEQISAAIEEPVVSARY